MYDSRFTWRPQYRIQSTLEFKKIQRTGKKIRANQLLAIVLKQNGQARIGITVSKKVGNAVVRNRIKRLLREISRHEYSNIEAGWQIILIAHPSAALASFAELQKNVQLILTKIST